MTGAPGDVAPCPRAAGLAGRPVAPLPAILAARRGHPRNSVTAAVMVLAVVVLLRPRAAVLRQRLRVKQDLLVRLQAFGLAAKIGRDRLFPTLPTAVAADQQWPPGTSSTRARNRAELLTLPEARPACCHGVPSTRAPSLNAAAARKAPIGLRLARPSPLSLSAAPAMESMKSSGAGGSP